MKLRFSCFIIFAALCNCSLLSADWLRMKVDYLGFGDVSYRLTNMYKQNYRYVGGWAESRVAVKDFILLGQRICTHPYTKITGTLSSHKEIPEENILVYGIGLENRIFVELGILDSISWLNWMKPLRLYGEYLRGKFIKRKVGPWVPREDWRLGAELWNEFNVDLTAKNIIPETISDRVWAELWADVGWRKTNFFLKDYKGWIGSVVYRLGVRYPKIVELMDIFLMPYLNTELSVAQWTFFWQNRALIGFGLRVMPFQHAQSDWLRRLRIYAEYLWVAGYFGDKPMPWVPNSDLRLGINFSYGR